MPRVCSRAPVRYPFGISRARRDFPVQARGEFYGDEGAKHLVKSKECFIEVPRLLCEATDGYCDARTFELLNSSMRDFVWVARATNNTFYFGPNDGVRALRSPAPMAAGFQIHIQGCPFRARSGSRKRLDFRVGR